MDQLKISVRTFATTEPWRARCPTAVYPIFWAWWRNMPLLPTMHRPTVYWRSMS